MDDERSQQLLVSTLLLHAQDLQHRYFSSVSKHHHVSIVNCVFSALHLSVHTLPDLEQFCEIPLYKLSD